MAHLVGLVVSEDDNFRKHIGRMLRSGSAVVAIAKMPACGALTRSRSILASAAGKSSRISTAMRSGAAVPSRSSRVSITLTGMDPERSIRPMCFLKLSSSLTTSPTRCAMSTLQGESPAQTSHAAQVPRDGRRCR